MSHHPIPIKPQCHVVNPVKEVHQGNEGVKVSMSECQPHPEGPRTSPSDFPLLLSHLPKDPNGSCHFNQFNQVKPWWDNKRHVHFGSHQQRQHPRDQPKHPIQFAQQSGERSELAYLYGDSS